MYNKAIDFIESSPITKLLAIPVTIFGLVYWGFGFFNDWASKDLVSAKNWELWRGVFSLISTLAIIAPLHIVYVYFINKKYKFGAFKIITKPIEIFEKELPRSTTVRIFASKGDHAKSLFLSFDSDQKKLTQNLTVNMLLRSVNGDQNRKIELEAQAERWKRYVDDLLSEPSHTMHTSFKLYEYPVMLSGYIFDDRVAMLAWYSRPNGGHRSLPNPPLIYLSSEDPDSKKLLDDAIKIFDCRFSAGNNL